MRLNPTDITSAEQLRSLSFELSAHPPALVILDPLYLSMGDAKGSDLYAMGKVLRGLQVVCGRIDAALVIVTHWNKTGLGTGPSRFSGVGPGSWGRVLASVAVEAYTVGADGASTATLHWELRGGEIPETHFRVRRRVKAGDPLRLDSPLEYEVEVTDEGVDAGPATINKTQRRVLAALSGSSSAAPLGVREIGDTIAADGQGLPLRARTIQKALAVLTDAGQVDGANDGTGTAGRWWIT